MTSATHAYAGIFNGKMLATIVDDGCPDIAEEVASWIKDGGTVERLTIEQVRANFGKPWPVQQGDSA